MALPNRSVFEYTMAIRLLFQQGMEKAPKSAASKRIRN